VSDSLDLLHGLVLHDGSRWGATADPWRTADAASILDPALGQPLQHFLTRPRGGWKTTDLAAVMLAWLVTTAPPLARGYWAAGDEDQAALGLDAVRGLVQRTPALRPLVRLEAGRVVAVRSEAAVRVLPADGPTAHGLSPSYVVVDELAQWPGTRGHRGLWEALVSSLPKVPGARLVVLTTAGDPAHWSHKVLESARSSPHWRVSEMPGPLPWRTEVDLAAQREALAGRPGAFERLHLNLWTAAEDRLVSPDDLAAAATLDGPLAARPGVRYVAGVDLGARNDASVVAVAHQETTRVARPGEAPALASARVVVDHLRRWAPRPSSPVPLDDVEAFLVEAARVYPGLRVRLDPWQALGMAQRLRARGIPTEEFTYSSASVGRLAQTLFRLLRDRQIDLPRDPELLDELEHVRLVERSGLPRMDHDAGRHDDQAQALALAATALLERAAPAGEPLRGAVAVRPAAQAYAAMGGGITGRPGTFEHFEQMQDRDLGRRPQHPGVAYPW